MKKIDVAFLIAAVISALSFPFASALIMPLMGYISFWHFVMIYNLAIPIVFWFLFKSYYKIAVTPKNLKSQNRSQINFRNFGIALVLGMIVASPGLLYLSQAFNTHQYIYETYDSITARDIWLSYTMETFSADVLMKGLLSGASVVFGIMAFLAVISFLESKGAQSLDKHGPDLFAPVLGVIFAFIAVLFTHLSDLASRGLALLSVTPEVILGIFLIEVVYMGSYFFAGRNYKQDKKLTQVLIYRNILAATLIFLALFLVLSYNFRV